MEWIDVNDRLPEKFIDVLVYDKNNLHYIAYTSNGKNWKTDEYWLDMKNTHWMPLPKPPK